MLRATAALQPGDMRVLSALASIVLDLHDTRDAVAMFTAVSRREPQDPEAAYDLAIALERAGDIPGAIRQFEKSIALDPSFADAYLKLAGIYRDRDLEALRRSVLKKYLDVVPQSIRFRLLLQQ